jgi:hypothetical protein
MPVQVMIPSHPVRGEIRFAAVTEPDGELRSRYWRVSGTRGKSEIVLAPEGLGKWLHLTLHESDAHWHYKITLPSGELIREQWTAADPGTGIRRALAIEIRAAAVRYPVSERDRRKVDTWVGNVTPSTPIGVELFLVASPDAVIRASGADPVPLGAIEMPDGRRAVLIASDWPARDRPIQVSAEAYERLRQPRGPDDVMLAFGALATDNALLIMDGHIKAVDPPDAG